MIKRILSMLLVVMMLVGLMPTGVFAAEVTPGADPTSQIHVIVENNTFLEASAASNWEDPAWTGTLVDTWVTIIDDESMMDCIVAALESEGYEQTGAANGYIATIQEISEFSNGDESGWMGTLNDWFVSESFSNFSANNDDVAKRIYPGDEIRVMYTSNGHGEDLGGSLDNADKTVKDVAFSAGAISPRFSTDIHEYTLTVTPETTSVLVEPTASNKNFQVRTYVGETEYRRTMEVPVADGTVITVTCGDPSWLSMNSGLGAAIPAEVYAITVVAGDPSTVKNPEIPTMDEDLPSEMLDYPQGSEAEALSIVASVPEGILSYQWQLSADGEAWADLPDAIEDHYTPSTAEVGTAWYRCVVTNTLDGKTAVGYSCAVKVAITVSGTCGDNVTWELKDGVLTISGTGAMTNFKKKGGPWLTYTAQIQFIVVEAGVTAIGDNAFKQCSALTQVNLPDSLTYLGASAFLKCTTLETIRIPEGDDSITIGKSAFSGCTELREVDLPNVSSVGSGCFSGCTSLEDIVIRGSLSEVEASAFVGVKSIVLPSCVTKLAWSAFNDNLNIIYFCGSKEAWDKIEFSFPASEPTSYQVIFNYSGVDIPHPWNGEGTKENPYQLATAQDMTNLTNLVQRGYGYGDTYFKVTNNIELPQEWQPIGRLKGGAVWDWNHYAITPGKYTWYNVEDFNVFHGNIDGLKDDGSGECWTITVPKGRETLLGALSGNTISNLNIYGEKIEGYGVFAYYVLGTTGVTFDHVTLKSGSHTKYSGFLGGYVSGVNAVTLRNCVVEEGVIIGDDGTYPEWAEDLNTDFFYRFGPGDGMVKLNDMVGSFGGPFNGYIQDCVSYAKVYGRNYVGGIMGFKGQSMGECVMRGCYFGGEVHASGKFVGGIVGSGYSSSSAPSSPAVTIENCTSDGIIIGATCVGGIFGGEETLSACWNNGIGYIRANYFTGTVTATDEAGIVGGIIGYMDCLNCYNVVSGNYYLAASADQGIGKIGRVYYAPGKPHGRADDPAGEDAEKLTATFEEEELTNGVLVEKMNVAHAGNAWIQGENRPEINDETRVVSITDSMDNIRRGEPLNNSDEPRFKQSLGAQNLDGYIMTVTYSDGYTEDVPALEMELWDLDFNKSGCCLAGLYYKGYLANFGVNVITDLTEQAQPVMNLIDAIGDITLDSKEAIEQAEAAYAELPEEVKPLVSNYQKLLDARAAYDRLVEGENKPTEPTEPDKPDVPEVPEKPEVSFTDITGHWAYDAIAYVAANGLMNGMPGKVFEPEEKTTRAMMAVILYRVAGEPSVDEMQVSFTDLKEDWYHDAVAWATNVKVVIGRDAATFDPNSPITREEMILMLWRYSGKPEANEAVLKAFADASDIATYAKTAMAWAVETKLVNGLTATTLVPTGTATRAQIATILMRYTQN